MRPACGKIWEAEWEAAGPWRQGLGLEALAMAGGRIDCGLWCAGLGVGDWGEAADREGRRTRSFIASAGIGR